MKRLLFTIFCTLALTVAAMAQTTVTGVVYDTTGETVIGASIVEKGNPQHAATTGIDGDFSIRVSSPDATLIFSYVGMESQEIALNGRTNIDVTLSESNTLLNEVVIVGYGTQKKINATGAVKTIGNDVLESRPVSNAVQGLQGAIAGLNITNDNGGAPGEDMNINIRGVGSIGEGSNSSPLVLIDGMEGDLSMVNPNDIENISVLKDAAASSIYGSRAPFGVILVTTKTGQKETRVTYSGNIRFQQPVKTPQLADSYTMALMMNDAWTNMGNAAPFSQTQLDNMLKFQRGELEYGTEPTVDGKDWKKQIQAFGNTDWYDFYLKKHTTSQEHNLSVTGGNDRVSYYVSGSYLKQNGLFEFADEDFNRLNISARLGVKFNDWISLTWISRFVNVNNDKPSVLNNNFYHDLSQRWVTDPIYLPNGEYSQNSLVQAMTEGGRTHERKQQLHNQANLLITPIKDWNIHFDFASRLERNPYTRQFNPVGYTLPDGTYQDLAVFQGRIERHQTSMTPTNATFNVNPSPGEKYFEKAQTNIDYFTTNIYTDYTWVLNEKHNFKFLVGEQSEYYHSDLSRVASSNIALPDKPFLPAGRGDETTMIAERKYEWSTIGFFGRINYNYDDRYMLEVNMRADGASRFPKDTRWGYFPSVSAGWNVAQEKFFEPLAQKWHYFKLRASYGKLGNQNTTSPYPYFPEMYSSGGNVVIGGAQATVLPVYNPYSTFLTWEKIENAGAGVDLGFLNNRLNASFDWYQRTTKDMVGPSQALSALYGADAPKTNNAELRTRGWEFEISWRDRINNDWSYGVSASISDYKTVITKYDSPDNKVDGWYQGKNYGDVWGYRVVGIAKSDREMANYLAAHDQSAIGQNWGGGDLMYADLDNSGTVGPGSSTLSDPGDRTVIGNNTPRFAYSFTLEAQWKFIDFRAFFQGIGKRDVFFTSDNNLFFGMNSAYNKCLLVDHLDYFRYAGSPLGANMDDPYYGRLRGDANNRQVCDRYKQNGAYLRLKNLQIGFSMPEQWNKIRKYVKKARIYVSGENLFTITKLKIYDPEAIGNSDAAYIGKTYPQYRTWSVGLELTF